MLLESLVTTSRHTRHGDQVSDILLCTFFRGLKIKCPAAAAYFCVSLPASLSSAHRWSGRRDLGSTVLSESCLRALVSSLYSLFSSAEFSMTAAAP